jgi:hypothetical protein
MRPRPSALIDLVIVSQAAPAQKQFEVASCPGRQILVLHPMEKPGEN